MDSPSSRKKQQRILLIAAAVPLVWSTFAAFWPAAPQAMANVEPLPSLAFDQYLVNRRNVGLAPVIQAEYYFTNTGTEPLTITELDPSCGCLRPVLKDDKRVYQSGESGFFVIGVTTAKESPGPNTYSVTVKYEDPQPRETMVRFKLNLPEKKLTVDPPELAFFQYNGQPSQATVYVTDYRGFDIAVTDVTTTSEVIDIDVQSAELDEGGNTRIPVVLHVPGVVPAGRAISTVTIKTNDPEFKAIQIPVLIDGPEITPVSASEVIGPPLPQTP